ncbi:MAG: amidohydrolase family protein, partial [Actinomycetota bacterium]|nr:amidohydrolase family protein [Actinomycetota bacterium]
DGQISAVESGLPTETAGEVLDAAGLMLCPGFIDMHAHTALQPFQEPQLTPKLAQGFTTELINPDGLAPAPVSEDRLDDRRDYLRPLEGPGPERWTWSTFAEYLDALADTRPATTLVPSIGHNAVRDFVIGGTNRRPDREELRKMREEVRVGLEAGARTLSFGLIYMPGAFSQTEELVALAEEAAPFGAPLVPHVRNEADGVLEAVGEMVEVARRSGAPLHLSHLKVVGNADLVEPLLELLEHARADIDITFDQYPYGAGSTVLSALLPPWAQEGGTSSTLARLRDSGQREAMQRDIERGLPGWENVYKACGAEGIVVAHAANHRAEDVGKTLAEVGEERGCDPFVAAMDLLRETGLDVTMIDHYATEQTVRTIFRHPLQLVGSDGIFGDRPHPRLYGTAARALGRYALKERLITIEEAVARLTARAADRIGLGDRGRIREGLRADLALLDPARFIDTATYDDPKRVPEGVSRVLVAGRTVWAEGAPTGVLPGDVLRELLPRR